MNGYDKPKIPRVIFGSGTYVRAAELLKDYNVTKCLVVTDPGIVQLGYINKITDILMEAGIAYEVFSDVMPNPTDEVVLKVGKMLKEGDFNGVIGFGGGSPMDVAKAGSLVAGIPEEIEDMHDYRRSGPKARNDWKRPYPLITITTTAGTAAEVTASTALTDTKSGTGLKFSFGNESVAADACIIDPTFTVGMPKVPTVNGAFDALAHAIETAIGVQKNDYMNTILLMCVDKIWKWLPIALEDPKNLEAREQIAWAAHNSLANAGVPNGHAIAHAIGAIYHMVHGPACAIVLPTVIRHHAETSPEVVAELAKIMGIPVTEDLVLNAERVAKRFKEWYQECGILSLQDYIAEKGYTDTEEEFVEKAVPLTLDDWKSRLWNPPIHEDIEECRKVHRAIYEDK